MRETAASRGAGRRPPARLADRIGVVSWGVQSWFFCGLAVHMRPADGWNGVVGLCVVVSAATSFLAYREHRRHISTA